MAYSWGADPPDPETEPSGYEIIEPIEEEDES